MKKICLPICLAFCCLWHTSFSQDTLATEWVLIEPSPVSNGNAEAWAIGTDAGGNIFWGVNKDMPGFFEFMDAFVYKLDADGNLVWKDTSVAGIYAQQSYNLTVTDSLVFTGGRTCSSLNINSCDALFFMVNAASGATGWKFVWDQGFGYEEIDGISLQPDGIFLSGWTNGDGTEVDGLLMKIDYAGNIIWQKPFAPGVKDDHFDGHMVVDDSMIYVCGLYGGSPLLGWDGRSLLAKFNRADGSFVDSVHFGRQDVWINAENALGMATDGTYLYLTGYTTPSGNNWDIFLAKFDKNLNQVWYKTWGGPQVESARAIALTPDGAIYIGGNTNGFGNGGIDIALLKFKPSGGLEWYKTWGAAGDDQTLDIHIHGNNLYLTGKTTSFHPTSKSEALLLKVKLDSVTALNDAGYSAPVVSVWPNPVSDRGTLSFENLDHKAHSLTLYNALGQKMETWSGNTSGEFRLNKDGKAPGLYFFQLSRERQVVATGKVVFK